MLAILETFFEFWLLSLSRVLSKLRPYQTASDFIFAGLDLVKKIFRLLFPHLVEVFISIRGISSVVYEAI